MRLIDDITAFHDDLRRIRRDLHAHPEVRYKEHRTADVVARLLSEYGLRVSKGLAGTGVVGTLTAGSGNRSVGLRADLDALPLQEHNEFEHRSTNNGVMHACGHDGHTAMLLGAARTMARQQNFDGTVHFIFQPAEEGGAGAQRMVEEGLFEQHPCDAVFGMHNWPGMKVGQFAVCAGPMLASSNEFQITVTGRGAHAALPHTGTDPVLVACQLVQALQTVITRNVKALDSAVLSVTQINGGDAYNVIPDTAVIRGTVRTFSVDVLNLIETRMREITETLPVAFGASGKMNFVRNYPPLINHEAETGFCRQVMGDMVGVENVLDYEPSTGSEDFAFMLLAKPGCYVMIGNGDGEHREMGHGEGPCTLHNPNYDFNDDLLPIGATYWVNLARAWLGRS